VFFFVACAWYVGGRSETFMAMLFLGLLMRANNFFLRRSAKEREFF